MVNRLVKHLNIKWENLVKDGLGIILLLILLREEGLLLPCRLGLGQLGGWRVLRAWLLEVGRIIGKIRWIGVQLLIILWARMFREVLIRDWSLLLQETNALRLIRKLLVTMVNHHIRELTPIRERSQRQLLALRERAKAPRLTLLERGLLGLKDRFHLEL